MPGTEPEPRQVSPARLPRFTFVTGNLGKRREAERILRQAVGDDYRLVSAEIELPEIQSLDLQAILAAKGDEAWRRLRRPLVVEETGLELDALAGFPGPLVKWMLEAMGPEGIARTGLALENTGVTARCGLLFRDGSTSVVAAGSTRGELVLPPRGSHGFAWDPVFRPANESQTFAELNEQDKDRLGHRGRAWRALIERLRRPEDA